jgi:enoyl-[acyl-carrier protein] reductase I
MRQAVQVKERLKERVGGDASDRTDSSPTPTQDASTMGWKPLIKVCLLALFIVGCVLVIRSTSLEQYFQNSAWRAELKQSLGSWLPVLYLAAGLGPKGIRVNAISAGPIKTIAASGVHGISKMLEYHREHAPLRKNTEQAEVGDVALFLASPLSRGVTGEVIHVDGGFHVMGMAAL